jgi:putative iron-regulated protein
MLFHPLFSSKELTMNMRPKRFLTVCTLVCSLLFSGWNAAQAQVDATAILTNLVDTVILPTYTNLDTRADDLVSAIGALGAPGGLSVDNLLAAQVAWKAARVPWERSEAFLIGPVDTQGIDPRIDTWPIDVNQIQAILDPATGPAEFTQETIDALVSAAGESVVGFHVIEYLVFVSPQGDRDPADVLAGLLAEPRRPAYLAALVADLKIQTSTLITAWDRAGGNFADTFIGLGTVGLQEMVNAMAGIAAEVADGKLSVTSTLELESFSSGNTLIDMLNNITGIHAAYRIASPAVARVNAALASQIRDEIGLAMGALLAIPQPLRDSLTISATEVQAAIAAVQQLQATLLEQLLPAIAALAP